MAELFDDGIDRDGQPENPVVVLASALGKLKAERAPTPVRQILAEAMERVIPRMANEQYKATNQGPSYDSEMMLLLKLARAINREL